MVSAVILAAGSGKRVGFKKQFVKVGGKRVVDFSVEVFKLAGVEDIVVVLPGEDVDKFYFDGVRVVRGGKERMDSVYNGVCASKWDYVLVHDSARANITVDMVRRIMEAKGECVIPAIVSPDSVIYEGNYINRTNVFIVQTPQKVKRDLYIEAYKMSGGRVFPDEGSLLKEVLGVEPTVVKGNRWNFKITYKEDLDIFFRMKVRDMVLFGYDIHPLKEGIPLYIGGVKVSDEIGAYGHSDGDVVIHSVVDAILSGLGYGDIGTVFPDDDPALKGVRSTVFANKTREILEKEGFSIKQIDSTLILSKPKIQPFRDKIIKSVRELFGVEKVILKAKSGNTFFENSVQCFSVVVLSGL